MQTLPTIGGAAHRRIQQLLKYRSRGRQWWTPLWRGLVADPESKHRKTLGASIWLYLYLLMYANRASGVVRRRLGQIQSDTGYPLRTIHRHLKCLSQKNYVSISRSEGYLQIAIKKWKSFHV